MRGGWQVIWSVSETLSPGVFHFQPASCSQASCCASSCLVAVLFCTDWLRLVLFNWWVTISKWAATCYYQGGDIYLFGITILLDKHYRFLWLKPWMFYYLDISLCFPANQMCSIAHKIWYILQFILQRIENLFNLLQKQLSTTMR